MEEVCAEKKHSLLLGKLITEITKINRFTRRHGEIIIIKVKPIKRNHVFLPSRYEDFFEKRALKSYQKKNAPRLINRDFTIFANSCVGAQIYRDLNLRFDTPFVGLYITPEDFVLFLKNPKYWLAQELVERPSPLPFPIGLLGNKICIFFRSDSSFESAKEKWERRSRRIHWENLYIFLNPIEQDFGLDPMFSTHLCSPETMKEFFGLPYENIVSLTNKKRLVVSDKCVFMGRYSALEYPPYIGIISCLSGRRIFDRFFDVVHWLNTGEVKKRKGLKL